jgi:hypothetical protein
MGHSDAVRIGKGQSHPEIDRCVVFSNLVSLSTGVLPRRLHARQNPVEHGSLQ